MIELTKGQEMALETAEGQPLTRLRMGLGWDKEPGAGFIVTGLPDVDLDATAVQFAGTQLFDIAFYNNLETRDGSVVHLGDNITGRGEGDDEQLTVDLGQVYPRVDTILFLVSSYQGHTLDWIDNAYCRLVDDQRRRAGAPHTHRGGAPHRVGDGEAVPRRRGLAAPRHRPGGRRHRADRVDRPADPLPLTGRVSARGS